MSGHTDRATDNNRVRTWMNDIPLGSLDQLQNAVPDHGPSIRLHENASDVPLPASRPTSASSSLISEGSSIYARSRLSVSVDDPAHSDARNSTASSLWRTQRADLLIAHRIPLPESTATPHQSSQLHDAGSSDETTTDSSSRSNSGLQVNIQTPDGVRAKNPKSSRGHRKARRNKRDDLHTIDIFVPGVGDSSAPSGFNAPTRNQSDRQLPKLNYWQRTAPLMDCLPHLQAIWPEYGRHKNTGSVTCIDYFEGRRRPKVHNKLSISEFGSRRTFTESLEALRVTSKPGIATRVLLIEDLSAGLIESLGSVFELDPEFFAEHLNRSGYDGLDYADELPSRWETYGMPKAHASLKWYRPVHENPKITQWKKDPRSLLDRVGDNASKPSNDMELSGFLGGPGIQRSSTGTSWRKTPSRFLENLRPGRSKSGWTNGTEAAEQRKVPGSITWSDPLYKTDGKRDKHAMRHQAVVSTNIFRRSLPLSTRPPGSKDTPVNVSRWRLGANAQSDTHAFARAAHLSRKTSEDTWENDAVPTAWEEKASIFFYRKSSVPIGT
nr:hypothetical protein CFP56_11934 [Quercus suber]